MTFNPNWPNAADSPGIFPPQNNINYAGLRKIINKDHNFLDTFGTDPTAGAHKKVTFLNLASAPVTTAGGNGILYSFPDSGLTTQLWFWNGSVRTQLTPGAVGFTKLIVGSATIGTGASSTQTIYANPGFSYQAYVFASKQVPSGGPNPTFIGYYIGNVARYADGTVVVFPPQTVSTTSFASFVFSGQDLQIKNNQSVPVTYTWSVLVVQLA